MDKRSIGEKYGDKKLVGKKLPENKKFKDVKSVVDTGKTIKDVHFMSDQLVAKKKGELFKRIKSSTIVKLIEENNNTESIYALAEEPEKTLQNNLLSKPMSNTYQMQNNKIISENSSVFSSNTQKTEKTSMTQMTNQTGFTAVTYATQMLGNLSDISFVILDLRDKDDYDKFHIKEAISFPGQNISRDRFPNEVVAIKNKENKMIIIYHTDERNSTSYAQLLSQKGFENVYMLSGGIEEFIYIFPEKCEGSQVQQIINTKLQKEVLKKDGIVNNNLVPLRNNTKNNIFAKDNRSNSQESKNTQRSKLTEKDSSRITGKITDQKK